ncbi:hypothetical protein VCRA2120E57_220021 [Vibrio crassostreae]|nr:hypothetical protein VCRA2120E57_220021 [Vibrio crassostreae]
MNPRKDLITPYHYAKIEEKSLLFHLIFLWFIKKIKEPPFYT